MSRPFLSQLASKRSMHHSYRTNFDIASCFANLDLYRIRHIPFPAVCELSTAGILSEVKTVSSSMATLSLIST